VQGAWRWVGGPDSSVLGALPTRRTALLAATRSF